MRSDLHSLSRRRLAPIVRMVVGSAVTLALVFAVGNVLNVGAAPLAADGPLDELALPCPTPQAAPTEQLSDQSLQGYQLTTATASVATSTNEVTTTLTPERPGRPNRPCGPPPRDGTARTTTGTPLADPDRPQRPTRVADPEQTAGNERPDRPTRVADPEQTAGTEPQPPEHAERPNPRRPGNPRTRPTSGSGYPDPQ